MKITLDVGKYISYNDDMRRYKFSKIKLAAAMLRRGYNAPQLSAELAQQQRIICTGRTINNYLTGRTVPDVDTIAGIVLALGYKLSYFFDLIPEGGDTMPVAKKKPTKRKVPVKKKAATKKITAKKTTAKPAKKK